VRRPLLMISARARDGPARSYRRFQVHRAATVAYDRVQAGVPKLESCRWSVVRGPVIIFEQGRFTRAGRWGPDHGRRWPAPVGKVKSSFPIKQDLVAHSPGTGFDLKHLVASDVGVGINDLGAASDARALSGTAISL